MIKYLFGFLATFAFPLCASAQRPKPSYEIVKRDTTCSIFIYSPGEREGLHLAYYTFDQHWYDVGQALFVRLFAMGQGEAYVQSFRAPCQRWNVAPGVSGQ